VIKLRNNPRLTIYLMWLTPLIFSISEVNLLLNHELWRDELQAWLIAYKSENIFQLLINLQYEGRPPLWHFLIWVSNHFSSEPEFLKVLTGAIYVITIFTLYRLKSFSYLTKIAISFGFYFLYGYSVVSRDYNLILMLCLLLIYTNERNFKQKYGYTICLLLSLTNPFGAVIGIFWILAKATISVDSAKKLLNLIQKLILKLIPIFAILFYFRMPSDSVFQLNFDPQPKKLLTAFSAVFIKPFLPYSGIDTINAINILLGLVITLSLLIVFIQLDSGIKMAIIVAGSMLFLNALVGYSLYWWHFGASYLLFLLAIALQFQSHSSSRRSKLLTYSVGIVLALQMFGSLNGLGRDFQGDSNYSNIRTTAEFISKKYPEATVVSDSQVFGTPLFAYLKPSRVYFPSTEKFSYFTSWKKTEFRSVTEGELVSAALKFRNSIIVTSYFPQIMDSRVRMVGTFSGAVWGDNFQIYEIVR
jgi:hypothetical protein